MIAVKSMCLVERVNSVVHLNPLSRRKGTLGSNDSLSSIASSKSQQMRVLTRQHSSMSTDRCIVWKLACADIVCSQGSDQRNWIHEMNVARASSTDPIIRALEMERVRIAFIATAISAAKAIVKHNAGTLAVGGQAGGLKVMCGIMSVSNEIGKSIWVICQSLSR